MSAASAFLSYRHDLFQTALSASAALIAAAISLPSLALHGLHTYIHPDTVPSGDGIRAVLRPPSGEPKRRSRSKDHRSDFDESKAQLFRLRLVDSHLRTRLYFSDYRTSFIFSVFALSSIALRCFLPPESTASAAVPTLLSLLAAGQLLVSLTKVSLERSASKKSEKQLSVLSGFLGFLFALLTSFLLSPSVFDFALGGTEVGAVKAFVSGIAGCISGLLLVPAAKSARAFWLGTDQLRWNLAVVSCGVIGQALLHVALVLNVLAPLLWVKPLTALPGLDQQSSGFKEFRIWMLMAAAASQILVLRFNLQMYLNEAVLCWYQRLHSSKAPDLDYGRAKVFLHNHYLCLALLQFFVPPVLALLLLGVSQLRGNLLRGVIFVTCLEECSAVVKEFALFMAWWIVFAWAILTMLSLTFYRYGFLSVS